MSQTEIAAVRLPAASSLSGLQPMGASRAASSAAPASGKAEAERLSTRSYVGPAGKETVSPCLPNAKCVSIVLPSPCGFVEDSKRTATQL